MKALLLSALLLYQAPSLVTVVRSYLDSGDLNTASRTLNQYAASHGSTPEYIEALSWLSRTELKSRAYPKAEEDARKVHALCLEQLKKRKLDADASLPVALGASIEVEAQSASAQGRRDEAIAILKTEAIRWNGTSIAARIHKNLNLLTLEGKPAPQLEGASLVRYRGRPVLLFFWAHWCSDCKAEIAIVSRLQKDFGPRGIAVIAPTRLYGYVAGGEDAPRDRETQYIKAIYTQYYAALGPLETPVSEANFVNYGVSTTPTLVLLDRQGIVRLYHPGNLTYDELAGRIRALR